MGDSVKKITLEDMSMDHKDSSCPADQRGIGTNLSTQSHPDLTAKITPEGRMPDPGQPEVDQVHSE